LTIKLNDQNQLQNYLLGRLDEAEEEKVETRLLTDLDYSEQLNILTDEFIERYANEQVPNEERIALERFVFASPERQKKLKFVLALKKRSVVLRERKRRTAKVLRMYLPIAASLLLITGFGIWKAFFSRSNVDNGLSALRTAYRDQRPVEGWISDFNYAPIVRGPEKVDVVQRDLATTLLTSEATKNRDAYSLRALGQYYLATGRFKDAVDQLKASVDLNAKDAKAHNDLGVAYLELGKEAQRNEDLKTGFSYFGQSHMELTKALELDSSLLEARFNLGLVQEQLGPPETAEKAWRTYLEKDPNSKWSQEARDRLRILEERRQKASAANNSRPLEDFLLAYRNRDEEFAWRILGWNREVITGKFVPLRLVNAFLEFTAEGRREDAAQMLDALDYAGELETRKSGDLYTAKLARFYRSFSPLHLATLTKAHQSALNGYDLCRHRGFDEATVSFSDARQLFTSAGDEVESALIAYWLAYSYFQDQRIEESRSASEVLIRYCRERSYKWLLAQTLSLLSNIETSFHEQTYLLDLDQEALSLAEQVGDAYGTQKYLASLASKYSNLYNFSESLNKLARCLLLANDFWPGLRQAWRNYDTAVQVFNRIGLYSAAASYGEAALRLALESKDPSLIYVSYTHLGMVYGRSGDYAEGVIHAQAGLAIGESLGDAKGKEIKAYASLQLGELYRQKGELNEAAQKYDEAISIYDQMSFQPFKFVAHKGRFFTYLAQRRNTEASQELTLLLDLFDEYRNKIKDDENRTYFFDVAQEVYDAAIDFKHSTLKDDEAAFTFSEDSRARSLLATMFTATGPNAETGINRPKGSSEIQRRMPDQVQIVFYAVLSDKILIWVISRSQFLVREMPISREQLTKEAQTFLALVTSPSSDLSRLRASARTLYDILIGPVQDQLVADKTLCIVPDKILNYLPFAALASSKSDRYLIDDHALLFSPSASVFLLNTAWATRKQERTGEKLLSVGDPDFDRSLFGSLPDLPSAAREAQAVAEYYNSPPPLVLKGKSATKVSVVNAMVDADVLHFASHYVVDERWPMHSQLLLAKATGQGPPADASGESLQAGEIYKMKLIRPRLAVLAACRTGVERYYNGEGMIGMARAFLAAGVPLVVASYWPVETTSTGELMIKFHEHRRRGGLSTAEALRLSQTEIRNSETYKHPYFWAPFVTIGGYASF